MVALNSLSLIYRAIQGSTDAGGNTGANVSRRSDIGRAGNPRVWRVNALTGRDATER